jgi:hypothetical protein
MSDNPDSAISPYRLWQRARAETGDVYELAQDRYIRLLAEHGLNAYGLAQKIFVHRILAQHGPNERCDECPCDHCGTTKSDPDGDHSCPCPYSDNDCPHHRLFGRAEIAPDERT